MSKPRKLAYGVGHRFYMKDQATRGLVDVDNPTEEEALELAISALTHIDVTPVSFALPDTSGEDYSVEHARQTALKWLSRWQTALVKDSDKRRELDALRSQMIQAGEERDVEAGETFSDAVIRRAYELGARPKPPALPHDF